jgi:hypothetical protein
MTHAKVRRAPIPAPTPIPLAKASLEAQSALASLQEIDANVSEDQSRADGIAPNLLEGLAAFAQGKQTNIVCMDGLDLFEVISKKLDLRDVIRRKVRAARCQRAREAWRRTDTTKHG